MICTYCDQRSVTTAPIPLCQHHAIDYYRTLIQEVAHQRCLTIPANILKVGDVIHVEAEIEIDVTKEGEEVA